MGRAARKVQALAYHYSQEGVKEQVARQKGLVPTTARGSLEWVSPSTATALREASSTRAKTAQLGLPFEIPQTEAEQKMFREAVYAESSRRARERALATMPTATQVMIRGSEYTGQELIKFAQNIAPSVQLTILEDFKTPQQAYKFTPETATTYIGGRKYTSAPNTFKTSGFDTFTEATTPSGILGTLSREFGKPISPEAYGRVIAKTSEYQEQQKAFDLQQQKEQAGSFFDFVNRWIGGLGPIGFGVQLGTTGVAKAYDIPTEPSLGGLFTGATSPSQLIDFGGIGESFANAFSGLGKTLLIGGLIIAGAYVLGKGISK